MSLDNGKKNKTMDNQYKLFGLKPQFTPASSLTAPTANQSTQPVCSVCVAQICILENHKTTAQNQQKKTELVGGLNPSEKLLVNWDDYSNIWENKKCSKPPTSFASIGTLNMIAAHGS